MKQIAVSNPNACATISDSLAMQPIHANLAVTSCLVSQLLLLLPGVAKTSVKLPGYGIHRSPGYKCEIVNMDDGDS